MQKLFVFMLLCISSFAQVFSVNREHDFSDTLPEMSHPFFHPYNHSVFAGFGFGNDLLYTSSSLSDNQPFLSTDIMYAFKGSAWTALTLYNLPGEKPLFPFYDISAGYSHVFNNYFDAAISLSSYHSSGELDDQYYESFQYVRLRGGFDWNVLYMRATLGRILEKNSGYYIYLKNSHYFTTRKNSSDNFFTFEPNINMLFGKHSAIAPSIRGNVDIDTPTGPGGPGGGNFPGQQETENETQENFTLMRVELSVPVSYNFRDLTIEAEPLFAIPSVNGENDIATKGFFIFLNFYYRIY